MQIYELPRGRQYSVKGNVVNVPTDISNVVETLPRYIDRAETIPVKLKRKIEYSSSVYTQNVRPREVLNALLYLKQNTPLYSDVSVDEHWLEQVLVNGLCLDAEQDMDSTQADQTMDDPQPQDRDDEQPSNSNSDEPVDEDQIAAGASDTMLDTQELDPNQVVSFSPGEGQKPLSMFKDCDSEYLAFPTIFCGHRRKSNSEREVDVHYADICKWELRSVDRRVALCVPNMFFKMKALQIKQVSDKVWLALKRFQKKGEKLTADHILKNTAKLVNLDEGFYIFRTIRGSPPYLEKRKKDVFAMIRQLGMPSVFMSLSAADTHWPDLLIALGKLVDKKTYTVEDIENMTSQEKFRLVQSDPVTCCRFFDNRVNRFFEKVLKHPQWPLGHVVDFFVRVEMQHRGSPHVHMILWIDGAPIYGVDSTDDVIAFVDRYMTCSAKVAEHLMKYLKMQKHKHSRSCRRNTENDCRFGYPIPPMPRTMILETLDDENKSDYQKKYKRIKDILENLEDGNTMTFDDLLSKLEMTEDTYIKAIRSSINRSKVFLVRQPNEIWINSYMKGMLDCWRANHDTQPIIDCYQVATYVVSYMSKSAKGMSQIMARSTQEAREGNFDLKNSVRHVGNKFLNACEVSAQEAAYLVLQLPITKASREVVFINTSPTEERTHILKDQASLENMSPDSTDIEASNDIARYAKRPKRLEKLCLADYVSKLTVIFPKGMRDDDKYEENLDDQFEDINDNDCTEGGDTCKDDTNDLPTITFRNGIVYRRRKTPRVIRFVKYSRDGDYENFCRERLMLYHPWKNESTDLQVNGSSAEMYERVERKLQIKVLEYEKSREQLDLAQENLDEDGDGCTDVCPNVQQAERDDALCPTRQSEEFTFFDPDRPRHLREYDIGADVGLPPNAQMEVGDMLRGRMADDEYGLMVRKLNIEQREFFLHVVEWIRTKAEPLHVFLSGGAGCGKSVVVDCVYQNLHRHLCSSEGENPEDCRILLAAPTGKAAYNIKGVTLHQAFKINPHRSLTTQGVLKSAAKTTLSAQYKNLKVLIIDEISMVGNKMFCLLNLRLQQIKENQRLFGGVHVIVVGDFFQLMPVFDQWIFSNLSAEYGPLATNLWTQCGFVLHELTQIMRQKDDQEFAQIMNRLREGNHTSQDIAILKTCLLPSNDITTPDYPLQKSHLFLTNKKVDAHNSYLFDRTTNPNALEPVKCFDVVLGHYTEEVKKRTLLTLSKKKTAETANLMTSLQLAENLRYEICVNIDTLDGICNGASGILKKVSYLQESRTPSILWVEFNDTDAGKMCRRKYSRFYGSEINRQWTPIFVTKRIFYTGRDSKPVQRTQFPLRPAVAKTIHKSQGDTLTEIVLDLTTWRKVNHSHYVGMSRVKNKSGLFLRNLAEEQISVDINVQVEMLRLRTDCQMALCYTPMYKFPKESLKVSFLNVRSLHKHFEHVKHDHSFQCSDIMAFAETRLYDHEQCNYTLDGYRLYLNCQPANGLNTRPSLGLAVYVKDSLNVLHVENLRIASNEYVALKVEYKDRVVQVVVLYRKCGSNKADFFCDIATLTSHMDNQNALLILGDFNYDVTLNRNADVKATVENYHNLMHIVTEPTFQNTTGTSTIDNAFTNVNQYDSSVIECPYSDHRILALALSV